MLELADKNMKTVTVTVSQMFKKLKRHKRYIYKKKSQIVILEMKTIMSE